LGEIIAGTNATVNIDHASGWSGDAEVPVIAGRTYYIVRTAEKRPSSASTFSQPSGRFPCNQRTILTLGSLYPFKGPRGDSSARIFYESAELVTL
jgi:hypothetical protein